MHDDILFHWLIQYHVNRNLPACLPYITDGVARMPSGKTLREGIDENELCSGVLVLSDGISLINKLVEDEMLTDGMNHAFTYIDDPNNFAGFLEKRTNYDGVCVFSKEDKMITRIAEIDNQPPNAPKSPVKLAEFIPDDFLSLDRSLDQPDNIGTKSRLAIKFPIAYPSVESFLLKRTPYTKLGLGKVCHFDSQGLVKDFFLRYNPSSSGPFVSPGIVGVLRTYDRAPGKITLKSEHIYELK